MGKDSAKRLGGGLSAILVGPPRIVKGRLPARTDSGPAAIDLDKAGADLKNKVQGGNALVKPIVGRTLGPLFLLLCLILAAAAPARALQPLKVGPGGRFLVRADGTPFFWLGDTAWDLATRLTREEAGVYLADRAAKGFTIIQVTALRAGGPANVYGVSPLIANDPAQPNEAYFQNLDFIVDKAESLGLYLALLPTWGDNVSWGYSGTRPLFNQVNAGIYGRYLGARYRGRTNLVWVLGGDIHPVWDKKDYTAIWEAMASGLAEGVSGSDDQSALLMTFHPATADGNQSSSIWLHDKDWLDFNMVQSGHRTYQTPTYDLIKNDYAKSPVKPVLDAEPAYEGMHRDLNDQKPIFTDADVRNRAYQAVLAGGFGHTYGANGVFQFTREGDGEGQFGNPPDWETALRLPGASQMVHLKNLIQSRPFLTRVPGQDILDIEEGSRDGRIQASKGSDNGFALIYVPVSRSEVRVGMGGISGSSAKAYWYNPRTGAVSYLGLYGTGGSVTFRCPDGQDWVLVLDDASKGYSLPGR